MGEMFLYLGVSFPICFWENKVFEYAGIANTCDEKVTDWLDANKSNLYISLLRGVKKILN